ncbi:MAG: right-handed parallel beta-helix repeat-containing protein, partial [Thermoplasmata archaeon]|nr:right-handed parallel beta-helix repeat-containing protein [Thermoplasmata archaeon]
YDMGIRIYSNHHNISISNMTINNNDEGIYADDVNDINILDCEIFDNPYEGMRFYYSKRVKISKNNIYNNSNTQIFIYSSSDSIISFNTVSNGSVGIYARYGFLNKIVNNNVINCNSYGIRLNNFKGSLKNNYISNINRGLYFDQCTGSTFVTNQTVVGCSYSVYVRGFSDVTIHNSSLGNGQLSLDEFSDLILVNTTLNKSGAYFQDEFSKLTVKWFLQITIKSNGGLPVPNSNVTVKNTTGTEILETMTSSTGNIKWIKIIEYIEDNSGKLNNTPHNITAYNDTMFGWVVPEASIYKSKHITINLTIPLPNIDFIVIEKLTSKPVEGTTFYTGIPEKLSAYGHNNTYGPIKKVEATWTSNDTSVATVSPGPSKFTTFDPLTPGFCIINATNTTLPTATANVTVKGLVYNVNKIKYYGKIQDAIDDANSGNTLKLLEWTFQEHIMINTSLTLIGLGPDKSIIEAATIGNIVKINANWVNLSNFRICNGYDMGIRIY